MIERHHAVVLAGVLVTAFAHLLLKSGAERHTGRTSLRLWLNGWSVTGYALLLGVTLMNLYAFKVVPIRANVILSPLTFVCVTALSVALLGERLSKPQVAGCVLIVAGIAVFNL